MDTESTTDERNQSISKKSNNGKQRTKERSRSQTTPTNTDINDPENLDYEDIDDNLSSDKLDESHETEQINDPVKTINDDRKTSENIQDEEDNILNKPEEINNNKASSSTNNDEEAASDDGELDEADLEDGEIHDPSASKHRSSLSDDPSSDQNRNQINTNKPSSPQAKVHCRFFLQGRCHWGPNCKFIHPNQDSTKNSTGLSVDALAATNNEISSSTQPTIPIPTPPTANPWISPQAATSTSQFFPNAVLRGPTQPVGLPLVPPAGTESAWERGLRSAKTLREQSMRRKQQDKDFNDKKFNLTLRDAIDEKDGDDSALNIDRPSTIDFDTNNLPGSNYTDQRGYGDRYHPYGYSSSSANSHYNNHHRMNNNSRTNNNNHVPSTNDHADRRLRHHSDDYTDLRNDNRNRKENSSTKNNKSTSKKDDSSSYKRNSSQQQYTSGSHINNDAQPHFNPYSSSRRGDDWQDPWDRSRTHTGGNRRSSGGAREPSYSSSSASSSSSSRSSHSRSHSTSSSSRSRSRSRSRPKRRSPSVTRATRPTPPRKSSEMVKNGNEKKSNSNKRMVSPSSTTNKFLPGRQISSHTLKKAEKSSNSINSLASNHAKDSHGKDSEINTKKKTKKENASRSDSTSSSSSSSDSDTNRVPHRSSSSSSDSSSSENDTRIKTKTGSGAGNKTTTGSSSHSSKSINKQLSSSSGGVGSKNSNTKSKNDSINRDSSNTKESSSTPAAKKRRDTSSSTGSTNTIKKQKTNMDSQKPSSDANETADSSKKKEKQKLLKKLQEVEKLINQRATKASS